MTNPYLNTATIFKLLFLIFEADWLKTSVDYTGYNTLLLQ